MQCAPVLLKEWRPIALPEDISHALLQKIVHVCAARLELRISSSSDAKYGLSALCSSNEELSSAEAIIHQALADEHLRQRIAAHSNSDIYELVEDILRRSGGG
jgi:hypothetical protein